MSEGILQLKNITKIYPGTVALQHVDLEIKYGEVHGIIGKNGAGKSTLVGIISGMVTPSEGEIRIKGRNIAHLSRLDAKKERIAIVPQEPQVITDFTVAENLFLGDYPHKGPFVDWKDMFAKTDEILQRSGLKIDARSKAGDLSLSEQQLLLLVKACWIENAEIIILDEASASLSQDDEKMYYELIAEQKKQGRTIILISHRTDEILQVCDRVTVLRDGRSIKTVHCSDLNRQQFSALIVGEEAEQDRKTMERSVIGSWGRKVVLEVEKMSRAGFYNDINFKLHEGEIIGLAGLRGSGRTEIFESIVGIDRFEQGSMKINQQKYIPDSPSYALERGIVYLPEDREREGIISGLSVRENMVLNSLQQISNKSFIDRNKENEIVSQLVSIFDIVTASPEQEINQLSGGNKQKVVVSRISAFGPAVYLLDEPTRGIDIAAKDSILHIIRERLATKAGVIMTSPGLDDLLLVCDKILVLYKGRIVAAYDRLQFNEQLIFQNMQGEDSTRE